MLTGGSDAVTGIYIYIYTPACGSVTCFGGDESIGCGNSSGIHGLLWWEFLGIHGNSWAFMSAAVAGCFEGCIFHAGFCGEGASSSFLCEGEMSSELNTIIILIVVYDIVRGAGTVLQF